MAPAFGEDDARVGRRYDMPFVQLVDAKGNMSEEAPFAGTFVKKADPLMVILNDLDKEVDFYMTLRSLNIIIRIAGVVIRR